MRRQRGQGAPPSVADRIGRVGAASQRCRFAIGEKNGIVRTRQNGIRPSSAPILRGGLDKNDDDAPDVRFDTGRAP